MVETYEKFCVVAETLNWQDDGKIPGAFAFFLAQFPFCTSADFSLVVLLGEML